VERKSQLEDADIAEAVMHLKSKELAYQAALASSARVMQLNLVNYL
jgi:flagellar hook-associated protein 3 FlgL